MEKNDFIQYQRGGYGFRDYYVNETGESGVDVYVIDAVGELHFEAEVPSYCIGDIQDMNDNEFNEFKVENGIF